MQMFEVILFSLVILCALVIVLCKYVFKDTYYRQPEAWYLDYARSFFPVLLIVFLLRSFIVEPFRIPSGSMLPTLEVGDFILVNKFSYGVRLPILHKKVVTVGDPKRGDVMVFRWPEDNKTNYIKRVIGVPGDTIEYRHKRLYVNGNLVTNVDDGKYTPNGHTNIQGRYVEQLPGRDHAILIDDDSYLSRNTEVVVPQGHYFMLGDNRDHSLDSRYWGFVPDENIVGKAFFIWFHYDSYPQGGTNFSRIGTHL